MINEDRFATWFSRLKGTSQACLEKPSLNHSSLSLSLYLQRTARNKPKRNETTANLSTKLDDFLVPMSSIVRSREGDIVRSTTWMQGRIA